MTDIQQLETNIHELKHAGMLEARACAENCMRQAVAIIKDQERRIQELESTHGNR